MSSQIPALLALFAILISGECLEAIQRPPFRNVPQKGADLVPSAENMPSTEAVPHPNLVTSLLSPLSDHHERITGSPGLIRALRNAAGTAPVPSLALLLNTTLSQTAINSMASDAAGILSSASIANMKTPPSLAALAYPWRPTGKLTIVRENGTLSWCTASLIRKGVLVSSANCIMPLGADQFPMAAYFEPAAFDGIAPYGRWEVSLMTVPFAWASGGDKCRDRDAGIICENDFSVLTLHRDPRGVYAGELVGYYSVGTNGFGFYRDSEGSVSIATVTHLGYPAIGGKRMRATKTVGVTTDTNQVETNLEQGEGANGGPILAHFSAADENPDENRAPYEHNVMIGVVAWTAEDEKRGGGTRFGTNSAFKTQSNIVYMVNFACEAVDPIARNRVCG